MDIENQANHSSTTIRLSFVLLHSIGSAQLHKLFVGIDIWAVLKRTVKNTTTDQEIKECKLPTFQKVT